MPKLSKRLLAAFVVTTILGACLHFLYALLPNPVTAVISPVNESLWEHVKILLWPYLGASLLLTQGGERGCRTPWLLTALLICAAMLAVGYIYHIIMGGRSLGIDIGLFVVLMAAGFVLPGILRRTVGLGALGEFAALFVLALAGAVLIFTFLPPDHVLFADLSGVNTWSVIPY